LAGRFPDSFLELPREVISTAMKSHQRYFSVEDSSGELLAGFVVITNGPVQAPDIVLEGNVRVLLARLSDARFYWREDLKLGLDGLNKRLESVLWLEGFGSIAERVGRLRTLSGRIADLLDPDDLDKEALTWAAKYAKSDLASEMVKDGKEFTKLQGYMGWQYALQEGAPEKGARALYEHFFPRSARDRMPKGPEGSILALTDRLDAIVGFWGGGFAPTGSKDPYALRRQAVAVLRLLIGKEWSLCLSDLLDLALIGYPQLDRELLRPKLLEFFHGRLEGLLEDEGVAPDIFRAVLATGESRILDLRARALALNSLRGEQAFEQLVIGARRVGNILAKEGRKSRSEDAYLTLSAWAQNESPATDFDPALLVHEAEKELHQSLLQRVSKLKSLADSRRFDDAYRLLAELGPRIDAFFDAVMVMAPEEDLRRNRLAFLDELARIFRFFAGFQEVVLEGERD
jgi:glycyl-tRNA synthetase beta chain